MSLLCLSISVTKPMKGSQEPASQPGGNRAFILSEKGRLPLLAATCVYSSRTAAPGVQGSAAPVSKRILWLITGDMGRPCRKDRDRLAFGSALQALS